MKTNYIIEIATADFPTTRSAVEGGADRIELCAGLSEGGTTPSYGTIRQCRETFDTPLFPIIRPRGGDFLYTDEEFEVMFHDVAICRELGCDGLVLGLLKKDGRIDKKRTAKLIDLAYPMEVTFHRAFDRSSDPFQSLEDLVDIGCQRILTSGQRPSVMDGLDLLKGLMQVADNRIIIMPGSGVRKENIKEIAEQTGAVEFHSSLRSKADSGMDYRQPNFPFNDFLNPAIVPQEVKELRKALEKK